MSTYANQSIPNLERKLGQLLMKHRELDLANRREEMVEVSTMMSDIALAINTKKLSARLINGKSDCRAFKKYGSCKRGNRCIWKHNPIYKREYGSVANHAQEEKSEEVVPAQKVAPKICTKSCTSSSTCTSSRKHTDEHTGILQELIWFFE